LSGLLVEHGIQRRLSSNKAIFAEAGSRLGETVAMVIDKKEDPIVKNRQLHVLVQGNIRCLSQCFSRRRWNSDRLWSARFSSTISTISSLWQAAGEPPGSRARHCNDEIRYLFIAAFSCHIFDVTYASSPHFFKQNNEARHCCRSQPQAPQTWLEVAVSCKH
jgi:hypothetical protein